MFCFVRFAESHQARCELGQFPAGLGLLKGCQASFAKVPKVPFLWEMVLSAHPPFGLLQA